jgi:DNA repair exonuclease SbcCD nuclease subunit
MKIAIITDQHFGARKNSKLFHDYFLKFYNNIFFPTLEREKIDIIIDMGDTFDSRKGIDYSALSWAKTNYYDILHDMGCKVYTIVGNHTAYYKNTNSINAVDLLLREYKNVKVISEPEECIIDNLKILFVPWINEENQEKTFDVIKNTSSRCAMGHLELSGFRVNSSIMMDHGLDSKLFNKFEKVFSGHFHTRSTDGKIFYVGNPYEIYWTDVNDTRGFTIFDTDTLDHYYIDNPYNMFSIVNYEDTSSDSFDFSEYENKIIKLVIKKKTDNLKYEKFLDSLYSSNISEIKIVENFDINVSEDFEEIESEDTITILNQYIEECDIDLNKTFLKSLIQEIYKESCEMV